MNIFYIQLLALLGLVIVDVVLGIIAASRNQEFDWEMIGNFFRTTIIPKVGGFAALRIGLFAAVGTLFEGFVYMAYVAEGVTWVAFGLGAASIVASIIRNAKNLAHPLV